jgi:hypothetical protein
MSLSTEQTVAAVGAMKQYLDKQVGSTGNTPAQRMAKLDEERAELIDTELKPLVEEYLAGTILLETFKGEIAGHNKRYKKHWGFSGPNGQLFFNSLVTVAGDDSECDEELRADIAVPDSEDTARTQIAQFEDYICRIRNVYEKAEGTKRGCPKEGSIPFFLSYFWQIQDRGKWPIYYTNAAITMVKLNLWQQSKNHADNYITFKHLYEELVQVFTKASGKSFDLYGVEHVFWFTGKHPLGD